MDSTALSPAAPTSSDPPRPLRFWESRRLYYNLALFAVCVIWVVMSWPHFRPAFTFSTLAPLAVLALLANLCYSAVYFLELPFLGPALQKYWPRWRGAIWILGTLFAVVLENYWIADEIYPFVR